VGKTDYWSKGLNYCAGTVSLAVNEFLKSPPMTNHAQLIDALSQYDRAWTPINTPKRLSSEAANPLKRMFPKY